MEGEGLVEMRLLFCGGGWARRRHQLQCWPTWKSMTGGYLAGGEKKRIKKQSERSSL